MIIYKQHKATKTINHQVVAGIATKNKNKQTNQKVHNNINKQAGLNKYQQLIKFWYRIQFKENEKKEQTYFKMMRIANMMQKFFQCHYNLRALWKI
jgi:metal-dependent amidase/aminoacylase/carboxypeptidase family protein